MDGRLRQVGGQTIQNVAASGPGWSRQGLVMPAQQVSVCRGVFLRVSWVDSMVCGCRQGNGGLERLPHDDIDTPESSFPSLCRGQRLQKSIAGEGWTFWWPSVAPPLHSRAQMGERNDLGRFLVLGHFYDRISSSELPVVLGEGVM